MDKREVLSEIFQWFVHQWFLVKRAINCLLKSRIVLFDALFTKCMTTFQYNWLFSLQIIVFPANLTHPNNFFTFSGYVIAIVISHILFFKGDLIVTLDEFPLEFFNDRIGTFLSYLTWLFFFILLLRRTLPFLVLNRLRLRQIRHAHCRYLQLWLSLML